MKRLLGFSLLIVVALSACAAPTATQQVVEPDQQVDVTVFKAPN
jgi:hypothetical protein